MGPNHPGTNRDLANGPLGGYAGVLPDVILTALGAHVSRALSTFTTTSDDVNGPTVCAGEPLGRDEETLHETVQTRSGEGNSSAP